MGILARIVTSLSPQARLLTRLARIAGESERLAASLQRHADRCDFPGLKSAVQTLAATEAVDAGVLRKLLLARDVWPALPQESGREGSNNWARLSSDLAAEV